MAGTSDSPSRVTKKVKLNKDEVELSYVEFYSGVGGWTMALEEAIRQVSDKRFRLRRIAALDHSQLCNRVFAHNFGSDKKSFAIERLSQKQVEDWHATIWAMSPPCQPHTRQHSNQAEDINDPRSASFLHLVNLIENMKRDRLPALLFLENVVGFESSASMERWRTALSKQRYRMASFHLNPTQVGLPNDRPRYFCVAIQEDFANPIDNDKLLSYFDSGTDHSSGVHLAIPELQVLAENDVLDLPSISSLLDTPCDETHKILQVPIKLMQSNAAWCFDIATPRSRRSSCFTQSYGRFIKGTGSILYTDDSKEIELLDPAEREFQKDWAKDLDLSKFRYLSGMELARIMGFSATFTFPADCTYKQQWKLIGNSLNVRVASKVVELGLRLLLVRVEMQSN